MQYPPTATYSTRNACLIDSAAHGSSSSSSSSLANGPAVLALEEALVLSTLLGRATSRADVPAALRAYDEVCRPRAELVMRASADAALLLTGRGPGVGLDPARLAAALEAALGVVENLDIKAYCLVAIEIMDRLSHARHHW
jgi:salicylate hydroxylase